MLFCCNRHFQGRVYAVQDSQFFYNRIAEYGFCSECNKTVLKLTETRYTDKKPFETIYKGRKAKRTLRELKPHFIKHIRKVKYGSKQNQNWFYGQTVITKNKKKVYAVNFNGEKNEIS